MLEHAECPNAAAMCPVLCMCALSSAPHRHIILLASSRKQPSKICYQKVGSLQNQVSTTL